MKKVPYLNKFPTKILEKIMHNLTVERYRKGSIIYREKEEAEYLVILTKGIVELYQQGNMINTIETNGCFGETGLEQENSLRESSA